MIPRVIVTLTRRPIIFTSTAIYKIGTTPAQGATSHYSTKGN